MRRCLALFHNLRRRALSRTRLESSDDGFTLVEVIVTVLIVAIIIPLAYGLVSSISQQSIDVHDTVSGLQQDQTAGEALLQYLHSATVILPGSNASTLNASILAGVTSTTGVNPSETPDAAVLQASLTNSPSPTGDATFSTTLTPQGGTTTSVGTYYAVNSNAVFTYYYNNSTSTSTTGVTTTTVPTSTTLPSGLASTTTPTNAQLSEIVAVGINVTFLAGPHRPTEGFAAVRPTTFQTTIYLQNATGAPAPSSSTTVAFSGGTTTGSSVTATASVSPIPDGGTVTFVVTVGGTAQPVCTGLVYVSTTTGTAVCTFTPSTAGTYTVTATFSGTGNFQPSASTATSINIVAGAQATTSTITATPGGSNPNNTLAVSVAVTSAGGTVNNGQVSITITQASGCFFNCTHTANALNVVNGVATWTFTGLQAVPFNVNAQYQGYTGTPNSWLASTATQVTVTP